MERTRAKMRCDRVEKNAHGYWQERSGTPREEVTLYPVQDDGTPENDRFHGATPAGEMRLSIDNPSVHGFFVAGREYYVDVTPAE